MITLHNINKSEFLNLNLNFIYSILFLSLPWNICKNVSKLHNNEYIYAKMLWNYIITKGIWFVYKKIGSNENR